MSILEAVRDYLRTIPGLENLSLEDLGPSPGDACLQPLGLEPVIRTYLCGATRRQEQLRLLVRRGLGSLEEGRGADHRFLWDLALTLEKRTRAGDLPELGPGRRALRLEAQETPAPVLLQEDGLLVDQLPLRITYLLEG